jgi:FlaA1/EpsC-like NDP-sugar epimerase/tetratricopeptide (TPR) repeat protein
MTGEASRIPSSKAPAGFADLLTQDKNPSPRERRLFRALRDPDEAVRADAALRIGAAYADDNPEVAQRLLMQAARASIPSIAACAFVRLAVIADTRGERPRAREYLETATGLLAGREDDLLRIDVAERWALIDQVQRAIPVLDQVQDAARDELRNPQLGSRPAELRRRNVIALANVRRGELLRESAHGRAEQAFRIALHIGTGGVAAAAAFRLAELLESSGLGLLAQVEEYYRVAVDADDPYASPRACLGLADLLARNGQRQIAIGFWQRAAHTGDEATAKAARKRHRARPRLLKQVEPGDARQHSGAAPFAGKEALVSFGAESLSWSPLDSGTRGFAEPRRTIVVGAGTGGHYLAPELRPDYGWTVIGYVDDRADADPVGDHPILGTLNDLERLIHEHDARCVIFAIPTASGQARFRAFLAAERCGISLVALPSMFDLRRDQPLTAQLRPLRVEETFGRDPWVLERDTSTLVKGRRVLITGAGGTLGSEVARRVVQGQPEHVTLLDRGELPLLRIFDELQERREFVDCAPAIADCTMKPELKRVFRGYEPDVVFHCAGLGHARVHRTHPLHAARANILGTRLVTELAAASDVRELVFASTDDAALRSESFHMTKALAEQVVLAPHGSMRTTCLRLPSIWTTPGSVLERFEDQLDGGGPLRVAPRSERRMVHPWQAAQGLLRMLATPHPGSNRLFALVAGEPVPIRELALRMLDMRHLRVGFDVQIVDLEAPLRKTGTHLWGEGEAQVEEDGQVVAIRQDRALLDALGKLLPDVEDAIAVGDEEALERVLAVGVAARAERIDARAPDRPGAVPRRSDVA